jgi:protein-S-isoprenylcysteine O-methyltransferase Ste14
MVSVAVRRVLMPLLVLALDAALLAWGRGSLSALRDPRAIALLAIWGAGGIVLAWRRPVKDHDAAHARPDPRSMLVLFFVPLLAPPLGALAARLRWAMLPSEQAVSWIAIAIVAAGLALRVAAMLRLRHRFSPVLAVQHDHELETEGPYAWVRHPGYLGALLSCFGGVLAFGSAAALPLVALMLWAQLTRVRREERLLATHFGDAWHAYAARTGALLPMLGRTRQPETAGDA